MARKHPSVPPLIFCCGGEVRGHRPPHPTAILLQNDSSRMPGCLRPPLADGAGWGACCDFSVVWGCCLTLRCVRFPLVFRLDLS